MRRVQQKARLLVLALALILLAYSFTGGTRSLASVRTMVASAVVSLTASVNPNPDNTLAAQLKEKEAELNAREALLTPRASTIDWGLYSFLMSSALLVLLALNYLFDWKRSRRLLLR